MATSGATILILPAGVEISAECYRSCQKDPMQTCDLPGYKCAKTKIYGYMCMPVDAIDECLSNPCKNGGSCTDNLDSYTCTCPDTHLGINCDVVNHCVENPCKNGGTCTNNPDDYTCSCCDGWTGPTCEGNTHDCYNITDKDIESGKSEEEICQSQNKIRVTLSNVPAGCEDCDGCCQYKDCFSGAVQDYSGTWHRTNTGRLCQRWDSQDPQSHLFTTDSYFPMDGSVFDAHNYCRDPDSSGDLWCYTVDATQRWESCGIPACNCQPMDLSRDLPETNSFK